MEPRVSGRRAWVGRILTALAVAFLLFDIAVLLWAGLFLRDDRLQMLFAPREAQP